MLKLSFSLEIVLLGVSSDIAILAPRYDTCIVRKSITIRYNFNESFHLYSFAWCSFVPVFFSPLSIGISSLGEERANLSAFRTFIRFALVWFCLFPLPHGVWEGLRLVIVALLGLFSYTLTVVWQNSEPVSCKMHAFLLNAISFALL